MQLTSIVDIQYTVFPLCWNNNSNNKLCHKCLYSTITTD